MQNNENNKFYCVIGFYQVKLKDRAVAEKLCQFLAQRDGTPYEIGTYYMEIGIPEYNDEEIMRRLEATYNAE